MSPGNLRLIGAGVFALLLGVGLRFATPQVDRLEFVSVGQGDCALIQSQGLTAMIDCGPRNEYVDAGKRIVLPELFKQGARSIDLLILTHPDEDHVGGLVSIAKRFSIDRIFIPAGFRENVHMKKWLAEAEIDFSTVQWIDGEKIVRLGAFSLRIEPPAYKPGSPDNEGSMFVRVEDGPATAILTGDAPSTTESAMASLPENWHAQILKCGHHGSKTSCSDAWIETVSPAFAVVSCGRNNLYHHPNIETLGRLTNHHVQVFRTDRQGSLEFRVGRNGFVLQR